MKKIVLTKKANNRFQVSFHSEEGIVYHQGIHNAKRANAIAGWYTQHGAILEKN